MMRHRHRKRRRGATLLEAALSLAVLAIALTGTLQFVANWLEETTVQTRARTLSAAADAAAEDARRNLSNAITLTRAAAGDTRTITAPLPPHTNFGTTVRFAHHSPRAGTLAVIAWTRDPPVQRRRVVPRGGDGISQVGMLDDAQGVCGAGIVCGFGVRWNMAAVNTALGMDAPAVGNLIALRWLSLEGDVRPYLHRTVQAGLPELQRLETDLNMTTMNLDVAGHVDAVELNVAGRTTVDGTLDTDDLNVGGGARIAGDVTADDLQAETLTTQDTFDVASLLDVTGTLTSGTLRIDGTTTLDRLHATTLVTPSPLQGLRATRSVEAENLTASTVAVATRLDTPMLDWTGQPLRLNMMRGSMVFGDRLTITGRCTGCR